MESFKDLIQSDIPVLVDFYADWCGPCKAMAPAIKEVAGELGAKARIIKIDVDKNQAVSALYQIRSIPTLIIFKKGQAVWRHTGMIDKAALTKQLLSFA
ncbi:MAG TPA: thioredoxin [Chitinophagales bacterium]|nr:thioredoxin [Chitinophagales bacterium]